jgi:hypothetical protein
MAETIFNYKTDVQVRSKADEKAKHLVFVVICLLPIAVSALLTTDGVYSTLHLFGFSMQIHNICIFRLLTGYRCPVCGMTRCFTYMTHGNIVAAWHMSHAGVPLYLFCVYESAYRLLRLFFARLPVLKVLKIVETVFLTIVCASVIFFFIAQFINPAIVA